MRAQLEEWLRRFREDQPDTIMEWVPLYLHDCDFQKRTMTVCVDPAPSIAGRHRRDEQRCLFGGAG